MRALAVLLGETPRREAASALVGVGRACGLLGGRSLVRACVHFQPRPCCGMRVRQFVIGAPTPD